MQKELFDESAINPDDLREEYNSLYGKAGPRLAGMKRWEPHQIPPSSELGFLDWYVDYCNGKRTDDDEHQIKRWKAFKARQGSRFIRNPTAALGWSLRMWAIDPMKLIKDEKRRAQLEKEMEEYKAKAWEEYEKNK